MAPQRMAAARCKSWPTGSGAETPKLRAPKPMPPQNRWPAGHHTRPAIVVTGHCTLKAKRADTRTPCPADPAFQQNRQRQGLHRHNIQHSHIPPLEPFTHKNRTSRQTGFVPPAPSLGRRGSLATNPPDGPETCKEAWSAGTGLHPPLPNLALQVRLSAGSRKPDLQGGAAAPKRRCVLPDTRTPPLVTSATTPQPCTQHTHTFISRASRTGRSKFLSLFLKLDEIHPTRRLPQKQLSQRLPDNGPEL